MGGVAGLLVATALLGSSMPALGSAPASLPAAPARELTFLHVGPASGPATLAQVVDANGRPVLLRGVNVQGLSDYWVGGTVGAEGPAPHLGLDYPFAPSAYAGGACPAQRYDVDAAVLCEADLGLMRPLGYNSIRLTVSWSLLEPQPGVIDGVYIERIAQVVGWARAQGMYTVIDMHQDAWSKYIYSTAADACSSKPGFSNVTGYDGAPAWASTHLTYACALNGIRELDPAVQEAFRNFYNDATGPDGLGLQEHYERVMLALANRFHDEPAVAGYEVINEPSPGFMPTSGVFDETELFRFYGKLVNYVVAGTAGDGFHQLFFVEPNVLRDTIDSSAILTPWSVYSAYANVVYAPHIYTGEFTADAALLNQRLFPGQGGYDSAVMDAQHLGLPLWVGEFGNGPGDDDTLLQASYQNQDQRDVGGSLWEWKEGRGGQWGVYHVNPPPVALVASHKKYSDRAYPLYLAGTMQALAYAPATGGFSLVAQSPAVTAGDQAHATLLFVPDITTGPLQLVNATADVFAGAGGAREAYVYPLGGVYCVAAAGTSLPAACTAAAAVVAEAPTPVLLLLGGAGAAIAWRRRYRVRPG